jgi:hypothetical protein
MEQRKFDPPCLTGWSFLHDHRDLDTRQHGGLLSIPMSWSARDRSCRSGFVASLARAPRFGRVRLLKNPSIARSSGRNATMERLRDVCGRLTGSPARCHYAFLELAAWVD